MLQENRSENDDDVDFSRHAYVAHSGALDALLIGFRKHLSKLSFADIKIMRVLRAAGDDADEDLVVGAVVATAAKELRTNERTARERIRALEDYGLVSATRGPKGNQKLLRMTPVAKTAWNAMEREFLAIVPTLMNVIAHYENADAAPPTAASSDWKCCDPLHPEHKDHIRPPAFRLPGH